MESVSHESSCFTGFCGIVTYILHVYMSKCPYHNIYLHKYIQLHTCSFIHLIHIYWASTKCQAVPGFKNTITKQSACLYDAYILVRNTGNK